VTPRSCGSGLVPAGVHRSPNMAVAVVSAAVASSPSRAWASTCMVTAGSAWPMRCEMTLMGTPARRARVAQECLRPWTMRGRPAVSTWRVNSCEARSGGMAVPSARVNTKSWSWGLGDLNPPSNFATLQHAFADGAVTSPRRLGVLADHRSAPPSCRHMCLIRPTPKPYSNLRVRQSGHRRRCRGYRAAQALQRGPRHRSRKTRRAATDTQPASTDLGPQVRSEPTSRLDTASA
jgi:hypothetical protein